MSAIIIIAIAKEQKELFGYSSRSSHASKGKKPRPFPWTKQFICLAYCDQLRVPIPGEIISYWSEDEKDHHI